MQAVPQHPAPQKTECTAPPPPGPTDFCECGPTRPCQNRPVGPGSSPDLNIADRDLIGDCNNGQELLNLCAERGIDTLVYMGVASNMCVQYRSMGLRNMKSHGLRVFVVADLVEAITSNGLDAQGQPNANFTPAGGSARIQAHIEQHLAPTFESRQLLAAAGMQPHPDDKRPHVVSDRGGDRIQQPADAGRISPRRTSSRTSAARCWRRPARRAAAATISRGSRRCTMRICS